MKARLPQGYGGGGAANLQQLARQAQKMQEQMEAVSAELEEKEYTATAGGDAVKAVVTGKMEVKSVEIKPEVIDPEDAEMLGDLVTAGVVLRWPSITCRPWRSWWRNSKACPASATSPPSGWPTTCWA